MKNRALYWYLAIAIVAYIVRLIIIFDLKNDYFFFFHPTIDAFTAHKAAINIANGDLLDRNVFVWQAPFYSYFLAAVYKLTSVIKGLSENQAIFIVKVLQIITGVMNCLLIMRLSVKIFSLRVAILAGFIAALYGPFIVFEADLTGVVFHIFFNLVSLVLLIEAVERRQAKLLLLSGMMLGLSALAVPNIMLFLPAAAIWTFYALKYPAGMNRNSYGIQKRVGLSSLIFAGCILVLLPWTARNYVVEKSFILISPNGGLNFYIGNNKDYEKTINIRPGLQWDMLMSLPEKEGINYKLSSGFYYGKSFEFIRENPFEYLTLLIKKCYLFWHGEEIKRNQDMYTHRAFSKLFSFLVWKNIIAFPFGFIGPLAIAGIVLSMKNRGAGILPMLFILFYFMSIILFFVTDRYRIPVVPVLIIYASYAIVRLYDFFTMKEWIKAAGIISSVFLLIILLNTGLKKGNDIDPEYYFLKGVGLIHLKDYQGAVDTLYQAVKMDPFNGEAYYRMGLAFLHLGKLADADATFKKAIEIEPLYKIVIEKRLERFSSE